MTEPERTPEQIVQRILAEGRAGLGDDDRRHIAQIQSSEIANIISRTRHARCVVCNAGPDVVAFVNKMLVSGAQYASVHRALDAINEARVIVGQPEIGYQSVRRHGIDHLPFKSAAVREIIERRARAAQLDYEEGTANVITVAGYAEAMMTKAAQDMADASVTPAEGLRAAQFLNDLTREERGNVGIENAYADLHYLIETVKEFLPVEQWPALMARIEERRNGRVIQAQVEEEFDPGEQEDEAFDPPDDNGDEDF